MRKWLILVLLTIAVPLAGQPSWTYINTLPAITVDGTAGAVFDAADINPGSGHSQANLATCSLSGANIRVTTDGSDATTSYGEILVPGNYTFQGTQVLLALNAIRDDSTNAALDCTLYGR